MIIDLVELMEGVQIELVALDELNKLRDLALLLCLHELHLVFALIHYCVTRDSFHCNLDWTIASLDNEWAHCLLVTLTDVVSWLQLEVLYDLCTADTYQYFSSRDRIF